MLARMVDLALALIFVVGVALVVMHCGYATNCCPCAGEDGGTAD
jgi:hypothetical protein